MHIGRDDFWIEIVRLDGMNHDEHTHACENDHPLVSCHRSISVPNDDDRDPRNEHTEDGYKTENEYDG